MKTILSVIFITFLPLMYVINKLIDYLDKDYEEYDRAIYGQ